jgi:RHS repeat-associated protein
LQSATANGRQWNYAYDLGNAFGWLSSVELPDHSHWTYDAAGTLYPTEVETNGRSKADCSAKPTKIPNSFILTIGHPSGASGVFNFFNTRQYRSGVHASECLPRKLIQNNTVTDYWLLHTPYYFDVMSLTSKKIGGPGLQDRTWSYDYGIEEQSLWGVSSQPAAYPCTSCDSEKIVTVVNPDLSRTLYRYGTLYASNEGRLLGSSIVDIDGEVLRSQDTTYMSDAQAVGQNFFDRYGTIINGDDPSSARVRPVIRRDIEQDGVTFSWSVPTGCTTSTRYCFDVYGNPIKVVKSSTLGSGYSRTEQVTYFDLTGKWILGQVASVKCLVAVPAHAACDGGGDSMESETTYDPTYAVPLASKAFGKLKQSLGYDFTAGSENGTLKTVSDGNGRATTLSNWYRGVPRSIVYADGKGMSSTVDDNGWIMSVKDENTFTTNYHYDPAGRLDTIIYPAGDPVAWNDTTIDYTQIGPTTTEYGIPGGHWKRTESTGNSRRVTYFDAMWRPLVEEQYDTGDVADTRSVTVKRYDLAGLLSFQSYPMASLSGGYSNPSLTGVDNYYDALGRATSTQQYSELGTLTTSTAYLPGFQVQVTNPRGFKTVTNYLAYDQPTTDWPVSIQAAVGRAVEQRTDIARDPYGKPLSISRHDPGNTTIETRTYSYNTNQELCRTIEPETGATLMGYDLAGNLAWSAAGLATNTACDPEGDTPAILARKASRIYDTRNRLKTLAFPDGRGDQDWTYTPDGLPDLVTTYNGPAHTFPVRSDYAYNRRRLLTGESSQIGTGPALGIGYGFDANGHLSSQVWPDGAAAQFQPNALGQPTQVDTGASNPHAWNARYYPNGALKSFSYGNGIVHTMTQNARQLPEISTDAYGSTKFISDSYDYDADGNVAAITDGATGTNQRGNRTMGYDALDRLMYADSAMFGNTGVSAHAAYTHDALDNLTHVSMPATASGPAREWDYCYDQHWQLTNLKTGGCGGATVGGIGYDAQGNVINKNGTTYDFDYGNRLRNARYGAATLESYQYDGYGRRVLSTAPGGTIQSLYSQGGQLLYQDNARTGKRINYYYLAGSLVNEVETTVATGAVANKYQHTDALGSPVLVTNGSRAPLGARNEYEPYGQVLSGGIGDRPGYTGHVMDAQTGMNYMQQRYYDPAIGRFLSVDPVTATSAGGNFNRYWYGNDNPYKFVDPDGREVTVVIDRDTYTKNSVTSRISVTSDTVDKKFSGYTLEDSRGGQNRDKEPIRADTYVGTVRTDGKRGWRIELEPKNGYRYVQIHVGNTADDVEGCFAAGTNRVDDMVTSSRRAMREIRSVVDADGSGRIRVVVRGDSTPAPAQPTAPQPQPEPKKEQVN